MLKSTRTTRVILLFVAVTSVLFLSLAADDPAEMLRAALKKYDLSAGATSPFRLQAKVHFHSGFKSVDGTYELLWGSPEKWRETLEFPSYGRVRFGGVDEFRQVRNLDFDPLQVFQLSEALDFTSLLKAAVAGKLEQAKDRRAHGIRSRCVRDNPSFRNDHDYCFEAGSGAISELRSENGRYRWEFSRFLSWDNHELIADLKVFEDGQAIADFGDATIEPLAVQDLAVFSPPENAAAFGACRNVERPKPATQVQPHYPQAAKDGRIQGRVTIYAEIETNGTLSHLTAIRSAGSLLDDASMDAVQRWRYQPMSCNGRAARTATTIDVVFSIGG